MHWDYNNQTLSGFRMNEVGKIVLNERANYTYTATLLSSQPTFNNEAKLDSVLVISFRNGSNPGIFSVTCISNSNISTAFSQHISTVKNTTAKGVDIRLDYVVSKRIILRGPQYQSHIFICGVRQVPLFVEVAGTTLNFSSFDNAARARTLFSDDRNTAIVQGILMARDNLMSVALIIVSLEASVVNVTCYDRENIVRLPSVEAGSSDNQVVTVDGTTETVQTTEIPQTLMEESTFFTGDIFVTQQPEEGALLMNLRVSIPTILIVISIPILSLLIVYRLFKHW